MKEFKKVLCAVDLSEHSKNVAEYAVAIAAANNAEILVVYAAPAMVQYTGFHVPSNVIDGFVGQIVDGAKASMEKFVEENFKGIKATPVVLVGYPAEEIILYAQKSGASVIVMGTHGRKGLDRVLFGSVAEKIVMNSPVPVLTIRPEGDYKGGALYND